MSLCIRFISIHIFIYKQESPHVNLCCCRVEKEIKRSFGLGAGRGQQGALLGTDAARTAGVQGNLSRPRAQLRHGRGPNLRLRYDR